MGIRQITQTIKNLFSSTKKSFPILPGILVACSYGKRPGLSTIRSTANIVNDLSKLGIPTGVMPDGSANLTIGFSFASTHEYVRMIKEDMASQGAGIPGTANVVVAGAGGGAGTIVNAFPVNVINN
jgi:hypothetical protein